MGVAVLLLALPRSGDQEPLRLQDASLEYPAIEARGKGRAMPPPELLTAISTICLILTAAAAWTTFFLYYRKTLDANWLDGFRRLYAEFWNDECAANVRRWLVSEEEYAELESILAKRLASDKNYLTVEENKRLDVIDRYCALMTRIVYFVRREGGRKQGKRNRRRELMDTIFMFWIRKAHSRSKLADYIRAYWPHLDEVATEMLSGAKTQPPQLVGNGNESRPATS
jgi:hypothetical protein